MPLDTFFNTKSHTEVKMESKMLREIAHDKITPKKSDKMESAQDFYTRLEDDEDGLDYEIEAYEVFAEWK